MKHDACCPAPMCAADLEAVSALEAQLQAAPWSRRNFADALAGDCYVCRVLRQPETAGLCAYAVVFLVLDEAHLLVLGVAPPMQRRGLATALLQTLMQEVRTHGAQTMLLEVRRSNVAAQALYRRLGFVDLHWRRGFYPAASADEKREDALVMACALEAAP